MRITADRSISLVFIVIGVGFIVESTRISSSAYGSNVGPNIFPLGLGIILLLLSVKLFFEVKSESSEQKTLDYKRFGIILVSAILYALLLQPFGYVLTTFLFLLIGFQTMEKGGIIKATIIAGSFSFGIYFLFVEVLDGTLPGFPIWF